MKRKEIEQENLRALKQAKLPIFNIDKFRLALRTTEISTTGSNAVNIAVGNTSFSAVLWKNVEKQVLEPLFEKHRLHTDIFCSPEDVIYDKEHTYFVFNRSCYNFPLTSFIDDIRTSNVYDVLERKNPKSKHYFLNCVKIMKAFSRFLLRVLDSKVQSFLFDDGENQFDRVMNNLWIKNGTIEFETFEDFDLLLAPVLSLNTDVVTIEKRVYKAISLLKQLGKFLFKSGNFFEQDVSTHGLTSIMDVFKPFFMMLNTHILIDDSLMVKGNYFDSLIYHCSRLIQWFEQHQYWPEISFIHESIHHKYSHEHSVEIVVSDITQQELDLFDECFKCSSLDKVNFFTLKPILIIANYVRGQLAFQLCFEKYSKKIENVHKFVENIEVITSCISNFSDAIKDYIWRMCKLYKSGGYIPSMSVLNSTVVFYNEKKKEVTLRNQLFPQILLRKGNIQTFNMKTQSTEYLQDLTNIVLNEKDQEKKTVWEVGALLIHLYKSLLTSVDPCPTLQKFISEYATEVSCQRLFLMPWCCGHYFVILAAYIFNKDICTRPNLTTLYDSPFFQFWMKSYDLSNKVKEKLLMSLNNELLDREHEEFTEMNVESEFYANNRTITIDSSWKNMNDDNCKKIIDAFTEPLRDLKISQLFLKNRHDYNIEFTVENVYTDQAYGDGVAQEAINLYWKSIDHLGHFDDGNHEPEENINKKHDEWFSLGAIISHCLLRRYTFHIDKPVSFYKILLSGFEKAIIDLVDMAEKDRATACCYARMYFYNENELDNLGLEFDEENCFCYGKVTPGTVDVYVKSQLKKSLYSDQCKTCLNWAHKGFNVTLPTHVPTAQALWKAFSKKRIPTAEKIIRNLYINKKHRCSGEHTQMNCIIYTHVLEDSVRYCPITLLIQYLTDSGPEVHERFLQFTTGSSVFGGNGLKDKIKLTVVTNDFQKLPEARTCSRELILTDSKPKKELYTEEEFYSGFKAQMDFVLYNTSSFGYA